MSYKLKIKVATRMIGVYEVANDDDPYEYPAPGAPLPGAPQYVNTLEIHRDIGGDGCWYVRDATTGVWWGWATRPCTVDPVLRIRTKGDGTIRQVGYKVGPQQWEPLTRVTPPAQAAHRLEIEIVDADDGPLNAICRYVISGGRAYKVCS